MMEDNSQIIEKITKIVNPFVEEMNLSLVDVEYLQDGVIGMLEFSLKI